MTENTMNTFERKPVLFMTHERSLALADLLLKRGDVIFSLDGAEIASKEELLGQLARVMEFPDYYGNNWDALEECLRDLHWLSGKGYAIQIANADRFIEAHPSDFSMLVQIIEAAAKHWKTNDVELILIVETKSPLLNS